MRRIVRLARLVVCLWRVGAVFSPNNASNRIFCSEVETFLLVLVRLRLRRFRAGLVASVIALLTTPLMKSSNNPAIVKLYFGTLVCSASA